MQTLKPLHSTPPPAEATALHPLWRLGFRPFYLCASAFAALSIALWTAQYAGWLTASVLPSPLWHAHEMLCGFAFAVITGFLFTAVRNWTNRPTPTGLVLAAIVVLWIAGRVLVLTTYGWASAVVNAAFPLAAAVGIGVPLFASRNRRNYFFVAVLAAMSVAVLLVHLAAMGVIALPQWLGINVALDLVLFVMAVMGGRVIPMFTQNGVPGTHPRRNLRLERAALGLVLAVLAADALGIDGAPLAILLAIAAIAHAARWWLWQPLRTVRTPIVWVLHAGYAWIFIHLALRAAAQLEWTAAPLATHALTAGAMGGLTIAMMTRTARGHTGRPLVADRADVACYWLVLSGAVVRVFGPMLLSPLYVPLIVVSAALWSAGFGLYAIAYFRPLTLPRADGKAG